MEETSETKNKISFSLADFIRVFIRYRTRILISTFIALVFGIILAFFVMEPIFLSETTVKSSTDASGLAGLLGGGLSGLGDFEDLAGGGGAAKELALYESILLSRRCIEETIVKFDLNSDDEMDKTYMDDAIREFRENIMSIEVDKTSNTIIIGAYHKNPVKAKEIVEFLVYQLNSINTQLSIQDAKNNREFLEERYNLVRKDLKKAEDSLESFQEINGIAPDVTVQAAIKTQVEVEAQIASEEVKLDLLRKILSPDQAEIKAQEEKIASLRSQVSDIKSSNDYSDILSLKGKSQVIMDFLRLKRDVEIQNKILSFVLPLYEQAKIEENKNTPTVLILDPPFVPERKAKPKRSIVVLLITGLVFISIYGYLFVYSEIYLKAKQNV